MCGSSGVGDPLPLAVTQALQLPLTQECWATRSPAGAARRSRISASSARLATARWRSVRTRNSRKYRAGSGRRRIRRKSMIWMKSRVRPPLASPDRADQLGQARDEAVVTDAEQRSARDVADAGGLDHERAGLPPGEALVPGEHLRRDQPIVGGAPGHHRRHPGALRQVQAAGAERAEPTAKPRRLVRRGRAGRRDGMFDEGIGVPHR